MGRYLVAMLGPQSHEWAFLAVTTTYDDAVAIARAWHHSDVFDLSLWVLWMDGRYASA